MVAETLTTGDIMDRIATLQEQVDDPDCLSMPLGEIIRREAEGFAFYMQEFWDRVQPEDSDDFIDHIEKALELHGGIQELQVDHRFIEHQVLRSCIIPAGVLTVTKIHNTEHPLFITSGAMTIWTKEEGAVTYGAPNVLITTPGTRRVIFTHLDSSFVTCHAGTEKTVGELEERIIKKRTNRLLA